MALKLNLPPRAQISKDTAPKLACELINFARTMLGNEQLCESAGGSAEGTLLVKQLIGICSTFLVAYANMSLQLICTGRPRSMTHVSTHFTGSLGGKHV